MAKEKPTTKICKHCATEIPYGAKVCPNCRKKQGLGCLPIVLIVVGVIVVLGALASGGGSKSSSGSSSTTTTTAAAAADTKTAENKTTETVKAAETTPAEPEAPIEYTAVTVQQLMDDLEANALKAQDSYKGQYLEVTGTLKVIDSSGKYIALYPQEIAITGIRCDIKNDEQRAQVANMIKGDIVTLRGKCKDVGEVMGYSLDIDSIDGYDTQASGLDIATSDDGYMVVSADELVDIIKNNAMQAQNTFKGKQIAITGKLGTIDSNGSYIGLDSSDEWDFTNIQCYLKNDEQKSIIMNMSKDDTLTIKGKCKDVGELLGYQIDIESIE